MLYQNVHISNTKERAHLPATSLQMRVRSTINCAYCRCRCPVQILRCHRIRALSKHNAAADTMHIAVAAAAVENQVFLFCQSFSIMFSACAVCWASQAYKGTGVRCVIFR